MFGWWKRRQPDDNWAAYYQQGAARARDPRLQRFYGHGVMAPETPLSQVPFVALDFETTGLNPERDAIVSVGWVPFDLHRVYCRRAGQFLVQPERPLKEESVVIHGITHSDVDEAPDFTQVITPLLEVLTGAIAVVHYKQIERPFLDQALKSRLGEGIGFPLVDTMEVEQKILQHQMGSRWNRLVGKKPPSVRLGACRGRYGLPVYQPHHALTDAIATAELFQAQVAHHFSPQTPIGDIWG
ncbi:3'-5' exonuclease [Ferrimonas sediminicola]|uniref:3'-5' exonuclease n=1 Tax=Ferrimonas sediminicola TaxID=2569538 RepID=A0A4U1BD12_9GAMM|nr:3'-5' exonuclease [Ferrimonas sediminicola]TKB48836.1 3'-5' exonuclease [Ferrimonas sediminicola]